MSSLPQFTDSNGNKNNDAADLTGFVGKPIGDYDGGMNTVPIYYVAREKAKYQGCDFACLQHNANTLAAEVEAQNTARPQNDTLLCGCYPVNKDNAAANIQSLIAALGTVKGKKNYKKILMTAGVTGYGIGHAITLAISDNQLFIIDQLNSGQYAEAKKDIAQEFLNAGYKVKMNQNQITPQNISDCATVSSLVINTALKKDTLQGLLNEIDTPQHFSRQEIDHQHGIDKQYARMALADVVSNHRDDRNKPEDIALLQDLVEKNPLLSVEEREQFWQATDKKDFVNKYQKSNDFNINDNIDTALPEQDEAWKDKIRKAVAKTNQTTGRKLEEYQDAENPNWLNFRDGENKMVFANQNSVAVEGNIEAFRDTCLVAKELGYEQINFGKFEEHPEYRAKLFLACLEADMKMNGAPKLEELKEYPEYPDILKLYAPKQRKALQEDLKKRQIELGKATELAKSDTEYQRLKKEIAAAQKAKDYDKANQLKEELAQNKSEQAVQKAQHFYKEAMKSSLNFYIEYGSDTSKPTETSEQRREKVKKHLTEYDAKEFFSKNKDGSPRYAKKEELQKYEQRQRTAKDVMGMNAPGPRGGGRR